MKKLKVFVCLFFILMPSFVLSHSGEVIIVKDGDKVAILSNSYKFTCRLYGIDSPETPKQKKPMQPYGKVLLFINNRELFRIETLALEDFGAQFASSVLLKIYKIV